MLTQHGPKIIGATIATFLILIAFCYVKRVANVAPTWPHQSYCLTLSALVSDFRDTTPHLKKIGNPCWIHAEP